MFAMIVAGILVWACKVYVCAVRGARSRRAARVDKRAAFRAWDRALARSVKKD